MCASPARAQEPGGGAAGLARQHLNPLARVTKLSTTLNFGFGAGPGRETVPALDFQPVIPFGLAENWDVVTRSNVSVVHLPGPEQTTGLGDLTSSFFLTPDRTGPWIWGAGPIVQIPTATDTILGTGKWSAGPTAALLYVDGPWVNGILVSQLWSFAGNSRRVNVNLTQIEVQISYAFPNDWYIQTNPTVSDDWRAPPGRGWTVPIGLDVGKVFSSGSNSASVQAGAYYNVKKPDGGAEWVLRAQLSWAF